MLQPYIGPSPPGMRSPRSLRHVHARCRWWKADILQPCARPNYTPVLHTGLASVNIGMQAKLRPRLIVHFRHMVRWPQDRAATSVQNTVMRAWSAGRQGGARAFTCAQQGMCAKAGARPPARMMEVTTGVSSRDSARPSTPPTRARQAQLGELAHELQQGEASERQQQGVLDEPGVGFFAAYYYEQCHSRLLAQAYSP